MTARQRYQIWSGSDRIDPALRDELKGCTDSEIEDRFCGDLEFGTGGLRGIIAAGTNRMNIYTTAKATYGFADYLNRETGHPSCCIAYDSRKYSKLFAETAAVILAKSGVKVYIFNDLMPTPVLSYAVRRIKCSGGIVITASNNPAAYNGYKVYGSDGCQITTDAAEKITSYIRGHDITFESYPEFADLVKSGSIRYIGDEVIGDYYKRVWGYGSAENGMALKVVYSPLNGTGNKHIQHILSVYPNIEVITVPEQEQPDENFTTCPYPNPEIRSSMDYTERLVLETGADIGLATDPDCDRVGVLVRVGDTCAALNGNETGILLLDYICRRKIDLGTMPSDPTAVKTIVTSDMADSIAREYGVKLINVLTGFKFIGEQIGMLEKSGEENNFIFGFEESCGYLCGSYVRDKDAVSAVMLICEMTACYKNLGLNLMKALDELYKKHGYYKNELLNIPFEGPDGILKMNVFIDKLRKDLPETFGGEKVLKTTDYNEKGTGLPRSNVLLFNLSDGSKIVFRPSGTEPKMKIYIETAVRDLLSARKKGETIRIFCEELLSEKI